MSGNSKTTGPHESAGVGMIIRQKEPVNLETPPYLLHSFLTAAEAFYTRSHFPLPELRADSYQLQIGGAVRDPFVLTLEELKSMPAETRVATLECAGNSRVFMVPQVEGAQWELGAVGNAEWTGVPLRVLLNRAGLLDTAFEVVLEGADRGKPKEKPMPPGEISYSRSLPRQKATQDEVLIAYQMNGQDLPPNHGYPVRAIVPGHFGMASVKWLTRISVVEEPFEGYWQTSDYAYWDYLDGRPIRRPMREMALKSEILRPGRHEVIARNEVYEVSGAAWAGDADVVGISVSADGGQTWMQGEFIDPIQRYAWRRWQYQWQAPDKPGLYTLLATATDSNGATQPDRHDENFGTYVINYPLPIEVFVR